LEHPVIIHLLADYAATSPEHAIYNALLFSRVPNSRAINSNQDFKFGEVISPGIFIKLVHEDFPPGTIHVCLLHIDGKHKEKYILALHKQQYFLAPDNGVLSIAFAEDEINYFDLPEPVEGEDIFRNIYLPAIELIAKKPSEVVKVYPESTNARKAIAPVPTLNGNVLRLTVLFNDSHGNAYMNIDKAEFEKITAGKKFEIRLGFKDSIDILSAGYSSVPQGQKLAFFGLAGLLQIAINCGSAAQYLALEKGKIVMVAIQ
jgi:S-adenosylmethionine hydrolase